MKIAILPGDGIGHEIMVEAEKVLAALALPDLTTTHADVGGTAYKAQGHPLPAETLAVVRAADAVLFGAVGDPDCDALERHLRPEQAILGLRKELGLFANLRPAKMFPNMEDASGLKPEIASAIDLLRQENTFLTNQWPKSQKLKAHNAGQGGALPEHRRTRP